jgi:hypothetical protein
MLMDHSNAKSNGIVRIPKNCPTSINVDFAFIRGVQAADDIHQSGFAGPVLTQQNMDFASVQVKINPAIGRQISEIFTNPSKL